jgi:thiol-disulfide isomerase/thioredoxin
MKHFIYLAIALAAGALGYVAYKKAIEPRILGEPPQTYVPDATAATHAPELTAPTELPDFTLIDRDGEPRSIRSWPNKSLIVNFWATWCAPCRREIPLLKEIQETHADEGFQVVGIAVDFREDVLKYADEMAINYPLLIGEQDALDAVRQFGIASVGLPVTVFSDAQGRIVLTHLGEVTREESEVILAAVRRVNAGELTPEAARAVAAKQLAELPQAEPAA